MRLGLMLGYSGAHIAIDIELIRTAEKLGFHSVWAAEAWGSDAVTPLAWIAAQTSRIRLGTAVMQLPGRSPANAAMTAMTLDQLSGGRFILGLGTSGPQVVEGWHGVSYEKPLTWMREYVAIVRRVLRRDEPLEFEGQRYQIPYRGPGATGLGKPLKSILHGREDIPIYIGAMAPKSQAQTAEIADGIILTFLDPARLDLLEPQLAEGFAKAGDAGKAARFDIAPMVGVVVGNDLDACRGPLKTNLALYIGGMGAREKNFYNDYVCKLGFTEEAKKIQDLYLAGKRGAAIAAVPDALVDTLSLVGPPERIRERFAVWKNSGVGTMLVTTFQREAIELLAELNA